MNKRAYIIAAALALLFGAGCAKEKYEKLEGRWEVIDVANIESTHFTEWTFENAVLTISYVSRTNPTDRTIINSGNYELKVGVLGTKLVISNATGLYNGEWDFTELRKDRFSIKMEVTGGVIIREFKKIL